MVIAEQPAPDDTRAIRSEPESAAPLTDYQRRSPAGRHAHEAASGSRAGTIISAQAVSPTDQIADGVERLRQRLAAELLGKLHAQDLESYGRTILAVLEAMGHEVGESPEVPATADGGIETVVDNGPRGGGRSYVQAKRLSPAGLPAGRPVIQAFTREVQRRSLAQGVFITTGELTADTWAYAERCPVRIVLIDGEGLASLMMRHGVGVRSTRTFRILDVDEAFFA